MRVHCLFSWFYTGILDVDLLTTSTEFTRAKATVHSALASRGDPAICFKMLALVFTVAAEFFQVHYGFS